jgi:hypothetical protein
MGISSFIFTFFLYVHFSVTRSAHKTGTGFSLEKEASPLEEDVEVINPWDFFL